MTTTRWFAARVDGPASAFETKYEALAYARAASDDGRAGSTGVRRIEAGFYEYTGPAGRDERTTFFICNFRMAMKHGFGHKFADAKPATSAPLKKET